jgi:hypothetical protein
MGALEGFFGWGSTTTPWLVLSLCLRVLKHVCDEGRVAFPPISRKRKRDEHFVTTCFITNDVHEQKQKEKREES